MSVQFPQVTLMSILSRLLLATLECETILGAYTMTVALQEGQRWCDGSLVSRVRLIVPEYFAKSRVGLWVLELLPGVARLCLCCKTSAARRHPLLTVHCAVASSPKASGLVVDFATTIALANFENIGESSSYLYRHTERSFDSSHERPAKAPRFIHNLHSLRERYVITTDCLTHRGPAQRLCTDLEKHKLRFIDNYSNELTHLDN